MGDLRTRESDIKHIFNVSEETNFLPTVQNKRRKDVSIWSLSWKSLEKPDRNTMFSVMRAHVHVRTHKRARTHTQTFVPVQWGRRWLLFLISGPVVHHLPQCVHLYQKPFKTQSHFEASALRRTGCLQQHLGIGPLVSSWGGRQCLPSGPGRMWDLLCRVCLWKGSHTQHRSIRSPLTPTLTLA